MTSSDWNSDNVFAYIFLANFAFDFAKFPLNCIREKFIFHEILEKNKHKINSAKFLESINDRPILNQYDLLAFPLILTEILAEYPLIQKYSQNTIRYAMFLSELPPLSFPSSDNT